MAGISVLFAHDHRFVQSDRIVFSESQFEADYWSRYLRRFNRLLVVARRGTLNVGTATDKFRVASAPGVSFDLFPDLSTLPGIVVARRGAVSRMRALVNGSDAVIARLPSELGLLAIRCARELGRPWAVEVAGCPWDGLWNYGTLRGRLYAPVAFARMRWAIRNAPFALYVTEGFLQRRYPCAEGLTASASNVSLPGVSSAVLEQRLLRVSAADRPIRLGLIGTLRGRFKGIQVVLKAISIARKDLPPFRFHVLGAGDRTPWQSLAERYGVGDIVSFDGTLPSGDPVLAWLDQIDLYLQPSLKEGLPRSLIEAMSRGCPAIASRTAGIPELLEPQDLVEAGNARELARLLRARAGDLDWMRDCAVRNWRVARRYDGAVLERQRDAFWRALAEQAALLRAGAASDRGQSRSLWQSREVLDPGSGRRSPVSAEAERL